MKIVRTMNRILALSLVLGATACVAGPRATIDLPPPCAPDVAARALADSTRAVIPPMTDVLLMPPERPNGTAPGTYHVTATVGVDGRVVPGTVRIAGPDTPDYTPRLVRWAERVRFRPATVEGCAIAREINLTAVT
jgi:hypothetical protein